MSAFSSAGRHCRQSQWMDRAWRCCRSGCGGCPERGGGCLLFRTGEDRPGQVRWPWRDQRQTEMLHRTVLATGGRREGIQSRLTTVAFSCSQQS